MQVFRRNAAAFAGLALAGCTLAACGETTPDEPVPAETPSYPDEIALPGERLFPESIAADAEGNLYISSNPGTVFRARPGDAEAAPWLVPDDANGLQTVFGVLADDERGLLWLCTNPPMGEEGTSAIKSFSLADATLQASYPVPAGDGPVMCNDMTIADNGDLYASEMLGGRILRLADGGDALEVWATDPEFATIDGISFGPGGELYANAIQRNTLLQIHRNPDGSFERAEVLETTRPMDAPDGLRPLDDNRMLQSEGYGGVITLLTFPEEGPVEIEVIAEGIDYASSVTHWNGRAYFPEGKLTYLLDPELQGQDPGDFTVRSAPIPGRD